MLHAHFSLIRRLIILFLLMRQKHIWINEELIKMKEMLGNLGKINLCLKLSLKKGVVFFSLFSMQRVSSITLSYD
jgi:hypothetical protein